MRLFKKPHIVVLFLMATLIFWTCPSWGEEEKKASYPEIVQKVKECLVAVISDGTVKGTDTGDFLGTGFFITPSIVVTARHVIESLSIYQIYLEKTGEIVPCKSLLENGISFYTKSEISEAEGDVGYPFDIALLKVVEEDFASPFVQLGDSDNLLVGDDVSVIGYAREGVKISTVEEQPRILFRSPLLSRGIISALVPIESDGKVRFKNFLVYHNTNIGGGISGAPLFLSQTGEVVGYVTNFKEIAELKVSGKRILVPGPIGFARSSNTINQAAAYWLKRYRSKSSTTVDHPQ